MSKNALDIAKTALRSNIIELPSGRYLSAGAHQFKTLWTRDFCFSIRGLIAIGETDVVKCHLKRLIESRRKSDALLPRVLDCIPPRWRVIYATISRRELPLRDPLKPEYVDEHGSEAIDSNLLLLLGAFQLADAGETKWFDENYSELNEIWRGSEARVDQKRDLIRQPPFSDWQDSVSRAGFTSYANMLRYIVMKMAQQRGMFGLSATALEKCRQSIFDHFCISNSRLLRSVAGNDAISLDAQLLGLETGFFRGQEAGLYQSLKKSSLWRREQGPGFATDRPYPTGDRSWAVRFAGMTNYHENLYWSWLMGYAAIIAAKQNDEAEANRLRGHLEQIIIRDQTVYEVYTPANFSPVKTRFYRSEFPFSWGAAFTICALM